MVKNYVLTSVYTKVGIKSAVFLVGKKFIESIITKRKEN